MKMVKPPGDYWMSLVVNPFAKKVSSPLSMILPYHFLVQVIMIPNAHCESLPEIKSFTNEFILGSELFQSLAESNQRVLLPQE
jgi:hypothetical protein